MCNVRSWIKFGCVEFVAHKNQHIFHISEQLTQSLNFHNGNTNCLSFWIWKGGLRNVTKGSKLNQSNINLLIEVQIPITYEI